MPGIDLNRQIVARPWYLWLSRKSRQEDTGKVSDSSEESPRYIEKV